MSTKEFSELLVLTISQEDSMQMKVLHCYQMKTIQRIYSQRQEPWSIWNKFHQIKLKSRNISRSCSKVVDQTRILRVSLTMTEKFLLSTSSGKTRPMMVVTSTTFWIISCQMEELKWKKLILKTQADSHSQCYWRNKSWPRSQFLLTAQVCLSKPKNTMVQQTCSVVAW